MLRRDEFGPQLPNASNEEVRKLLQIGQNLTLERRGDSAIVKDKFP